MTAQLRHLCRYIAGLDLQTLPDAVLDHVKLVLLDTLGVITAGAHELHVDNTAKYLEANANELIALPCPGRRERLNPLDAAQLIGMAGSSLEFEEGNSRAMGHPAVQIVPALIVDGASRHSTGKDVLLGLVGGYEIACRISRASQTRRGLHPNGTWGVVGSAVGVGKLRRLEEEALVQIANMAAGFAFSPFVKNSFAGRKIASGFAGMVNYIGLWTNILFEKEFDADPGCFRATFSQFVSEGLDPDLLVEGLGKDFAIVENYFKPYPTCRFTHPALDALAVLQTKHRLDPGRIKQVTVHSFKAAVHAGYEPPANAESLRFSLPYQLAIQLIHGRIDLDTLTAARLQEKAVRETAKKVKLVYSADFERLRPGRNLARVSILMTDSSEVAHQIDNCQGDPANPLTRQAVMTKFINLTESALGRPRAEAAAAMIETIEKQKDLRETIDLLKA